MNKFILALLFSCCSNLAGGNERLFEPPRDSFGRINPNGEMLAVVVQDKGHYKLDTIDIATKNRKTVYSTEVLDAEDTALTAIEWVDNDSLIVRVVVLTEGVAKLSDTKNKTHIFVIDVDEQPVVRFIESDGMLIDALPDEEGSILFARPGRTSVVYKVNTELLHEWGKPLAKTARVDGGQFSRKTRVAEVDGYVLRWLTSQSGNVRSVLRVNEDGLAVLIRKSETEEWETEREWPSDPRQMKRKKRKAADGADPAEFYLPLTQIEGTRDFIVIVEDDDGQNSIYRYNYASQEKMLVYRHPTAEFINAGMNEAGTDVIYVSYFENGVVRYHYVDGVHREIAAQIASRYPEYTASIAATDESERQFLVFLTSPTQPGIAFILDKKTGELTEQYATMPWIEESLLSDVSSGTVNSGGLEIEYFLTIPDSASKVPLLVYPHGGPWGISDNRLFNPVVQYLASRGMAVLQVNYRGSSGYGDDFIQQGKGEFGKRMLDDIEQATSKVLRNPAIDANKVCAIGESYGGYAAMMLAIRSPERYQCVASFAGVSDLGLLLGSYDEDDADTLFDLLVNDESADNVQYEHLRDLSPLYKAESLQAPMLMAHGLNDVRVDIEHSYRMVQRLRQLEKPVEWLEFGDTGHSFSSPDVAIDYYRSLADFIEKHVVDASTNARADL